MAAIEKLTDKGIQAAIKAVALADKSKTISDGGGLVLEVQPSGAGWWRLRYTVGADSNLSHRADPILSQGWKPTLRWSAVDKCRSVSGSLGSSVR